MTDGNNVIGLTDRMLCADVCAQVAQQLLWGRCM